MLVSKFDTEYIDPSGESQHIYVEVSSFYKDDNAIAYSFTKEPAELVLGLGGFADTSAGQLIATSLSADVGPLEKFVDKENLDELPTIFAKEQFLFVPAYSKAFEQIDIPTAPTQTAVVPVVVLSRDFEPIVTNVATLFVP
jgi:hypothetical protein